MHRTFAALFVAACLVPACTSADPPLPLTDPPPITGGTLSITPDGVAVAADPDRDVVWLVDLTSQSVRGVALAPGDQPGRVALDTAGRAHVALRGSGALVTIDVDKAAVVGRRNVCPAPRGVAYDPGADVVHVACEGGELVTLPAAGGAAVRSLSLDRDLRDVVVQGDELLVSRFRSPELLVVSAAGQVQSRVSPLPTRGEDPNSFSSTTTVTSVPTVAWRTIALPTGDLAMVHQMATSIPVGTDSGAYGWGNACAGPVVTSTITFFEGDGSLGDDKPMPMIDPVLPVDIAADSSGNLGVVSAGTAQVSLVGRRQDLERRAAADGCDTVGSLSDGFANVLSATPTAIAVWNDRWFVQTRETAQIVEINPGDSSVLSTIPLGSVGVLSFGSTTFHTSWTGVACASCHPEGREDGHTWRFDGLGLRRSQSLAGGVMHRAPFHWRGEFHDFPALVNDVLVGRMTGDAPNVLQVQEFARWLDSLPAPAASPTGTAAQIEHGQKLFESPDVGCTTCHAGPYLTNDQRVDVGTGNTFQVPSLVGVSARAPFFHDGCAKALADRFDPARASCNGGDHHGHTSQLSADDVRDLIAYLETL